MASISLLRNKKYSIDTLQFASLLYLGTPLLLFFISWLEWYYALLMITFLILPFLNFNYKISFRSYKKFINYFIVFSIFLILLGYGEIFPQSGDWAKHNALFSEIYYQWNQPMYIKYNGEQHFLCYGLGFYMIPSWVSGLLKCYSLLRWLVLVNSTLVLTLIGFWINRIWNLSVWMVIAIFFIDRLDWVIDLRYLIKESSCYYDLIDGIIGFNSFDIIDQIPQHSLAIILVALVCIYQIKNNNINLIFVLLLFVIGLFWSPFLGSGLLLLIIFILVKFKMKNEKVNFYYLLPITITLFIILYYYSLHLKVDNFIFKWKNLKHYIYVFITRFFPNYILPFVFILIFNYKKKLINHIDFIIIILLIISAGIYSQIHYGYWNDFDDKSTLIATIVLNIYILYLAKLNFSYKPYKFLIIFILVTGTLLPVKFTIFKYYKNHNKFLLSNNKKIVLSEATLEKVKTKYSFVSQYLGKPNYYTELLFKHQKSNK